MSQLSTPSTTGENLVFAYAIGFLVLFSSFLVASFICFCHQHISQQGNSPRIIIIGEGNNDNVDEEIWADGVDQSVINSYPTFPFLEGDIDSVCAICLSEYIEAEMMRMLPDCKHYFHLNCVDAWLELHASCPVCRCFTPLAEVVPLSQHSNLRDTADVNESGSSQVRAES